MRALRFATSALRFAKSPLSKLLLKHHGTRSAVNGIGDNNSTFKAAGRRIPVPVLESLQLLSVTGPETS